MWLEWMGKESHPPHREFPGSRPQVQLLELDLQSPPWAMRGDTPETVHGDGDVVDQFLHVPQRFHQREWQVQKLRSLPCLGRNPQRSPICLRELLRGTRWLISGGGRGITFHLACLLGENGAKLELLGRTLRPTVAWHEKTADEIQSLRRETIRRALAEKASLPAVTAAFDAACELSRNLHKLDAQGIEYRYHSLDVSDRPKLWDLAETLHSRGELIDGILHGAGFEQTTLLSKKSLESIRKTIAAKVQGCLNLESIVAPSTRWFVQCGSLAGFFGGVGQVDYAAANGFLGDRTEQLRQRWPNIDCLTIGWPGWEEVGMAARPSSRWALQNAGHSLMPLHEGIGHFQWLLEHRIRGHILICNPAEIPASFCSTAPDHHG
jgi:NAD(P)-dependent dehydrogenase (short-subunit alcohol dehydrogenase family)